MLTPALAAAAADVAMQGSSYTFPGRPGSNDETLADVHHSFIGMQQDVAKASTVLIIG